MQLNKYRVFGVAFVPVEVEIPVYAENEEEACWKAQQLEDVVDAPQGVQPRYADYIVPGSHDDTAAFDFAANQAIPMPEDS